MFDLDNIEYVVSIQDKLGENLQTLSTTVDAFNDYTFRSSKGVVADYHVLQSCLGFGFDLSNKNRIIVSVVDSQVLTLIQYIDNIKVCKSVESKGIVVPTYCFVMDSYVVSFGNWMYRRHLFLTDALYYLIQYYNISLDRLEQERRLYMKANDCVWCVNLKPDFKIGYTKILFMRGSVI